MCANNVIKFVIMLCLPSLFLTGEEAFREFSNPAGQTITVRPVSVYGNEVRIQYEDGREMNVPLSAFKKEDAAFLKNWAISHLAADDYLLRVEVARRTDKVKDYKKDVSLTGGGVAKDALEIKEFDGYYEVSIENRSDFELEGLRMEYLLFSEEEQRAATSKEDVVYERVDGKLTYDLMPRTSKTLNTTKTRMTESKLGKGIKWSNGGDLKSGAKLMGVWLRIYNEDSLVYEYALPSSLMDREKW